VHPLEPQRQAAHLDTPGPYERAQRGGLESGRNDLATASNDKTVRLWDAADGSPRGILEGHIDDVYGLAFSPDGRLCSSSWDKTIRLWDSASKQTLLILKGHAGRIRCIKFSPDGLTLASASEDRTLKLWEGAPAAALASGNNEATPDTSFQIPRAFSVDPNSGFFVLLSEKRADKVYGNLVGEDARRLERPDLDRATWPRRGGLGARDQFEVMRSGATAP
jgi:WD40 repeat protein